MSTLNDTFFASDIAWLWFSKVAGSIAGAIISLFYMPPHGRREAAARFVVGIICGIVFGGAASVKITKALALEAVLGRTELMLIGSTSASLRKTWSRCPGLHSLPFSRIGTWHSTIRNAPMTAE